MVQFWQKAGSQSGHIARVVYAREKGMAETRTPSMLQVFNEHFDRAARYVKAPTDLLEYIRACHSMYSIKFPVRIRGEVLDVEPSFGRQKARVENQSGSVVGVTF